MDHHVIYFLGEKPINEPHKAVNEANRKSDPLESCNNHRK
jgi:hypothetical protein